jgi:uncharacterized protein (TIGR00106 family)
VIAEVSIVPFGQGVSLSRSIAKILRMIDDSGLDYQLGPMGTCIEGDFDAVMALISRCHKQMRRESVRVLTTIKIDDRQGSRQALQKKVQSVVKKSGRKLKTLN